MVQSYKNESKSQQCPVNYEWWCCCDVWYKVTKMRANHNFMAYCDKYARAVMYGTKLQKWEQITTWRTKRLWRMCCDVWYKVTKMRANHNIIARLKAASMLWCMVQSYKNESKSQLITMRKSSFLAVMYGTKLQKWEQITTSAGSTMSSMALWCMVQSYKNESKSQQECLSSVIIFAVMYGTKLQKWEQITTITSNFTHVI